jgi:membrane associated rhomboid family serine protease
MSIWQEIKDSYRFGSVLTRLIYINIAVFLILRLIHVFIAITSGPIDENQFNLLWWLSVPSAPDQLIMRPWTIVTYMFVHFQFLHILFNILYLYWFGKLFIQLMGSKKLVPVYMLGGISGAIFYILAINLVPSFYTHFPSNILMGASASTMAIMMAVATYAPNHTLNLMFIGEVRLKYIALVFITIDVLSISTFENTGGILSHLGGVLFGFSYSAMLVKGTDVSSPFNSMGKSIGSLFKPKSKLKVTYKRPLTDFEYNAQKVRKQKELDRILEKIKHSGYDSLSKEEKSVLFEASKE